MELKGTFTRGLMLIAYYVFMGTIFLGLPWSQLWPRAVHLPLWLGLVFTSPLTKGLVSGFGLILLFAAIIETFHVFRRR